MAFNSLTATTLCALNTTNSFSHFNFQPVWSHSRGAQIQHDCYNALNQVPDDFSFQPLDGGPYTFSSGICMLGIYMVEPGYGHTLRFPETWKNIKHWISDTMLCIFAMENQLVGSVLNLNSGVQICIWEPADVDPNAACRTAIPYSRNRLLTLQECLVQREVRGSRRVLYLPSPGNVASQTLAQNGISPLSPHRSNQAVQQAQSGMSPSTPLRQDQNQAQAMMQSPPSVHGGTTPYQAQAVSGDIMADSPALQSFRRPPALPILKLRGAWTNGPLSIAECQKNLVTIRSFPIQRNVITQWAVSGPIIHHSPPCSVGIYVTHPLIAANPITQITTSWRDVDEYLRILIGSEERNELGAFMDLPSRIQLVLFNGPWLDPENRLSQTKTSSLQSELDALAAIMSTIRLRNLSAADYESNARLVTEYWH